MPVTIAIISAKGGVGKTATAVNLGAAFAGRRIRTLLVDLDPQAALTAAVGLPKDMHHTTYDILVEGAEVERVVRHLSDHLLVLPASLDLASAELKLVNELGREYILRDKLKGHNSACILIDCPPSLGLLTVNALCAADYALIPCQTQALAYRGMELLLETVSKIQRRANPYLKLLGILPTMLDRRRSHDREILEALHSVYKEHVLPVAIPYRVAVADSFNSAKSVLETEPNSDVAQAYQQLAEVIINVKRAV